MKKRSKIQLVVDTLAFPLRAFTLFHYDKWGFSSLSSERYDYAARYVIGRCLDVGCGRHNRFVEEYLGGNGVGIDVYEYEGLSDEHVVSDLSEFPFDDGEFDTVTFLANINHIPKSMRDRELSEAWRCLSSKGNVIVTMGNPLAEVVVHKVVWFYDKLFGTNNDMDSERGMDEEEEYYLNDREIVSRLRKAGFGNIQKKYFFTQWGLNHLFVGWKSGE